MTPAELLLPVTATVFLAALIQGISGFGSALVAVPLLSLFLPLSTVVPLIALLSITVTVANLWHVRHALQLAPLYPLLAGSLIGLPLGLFFLIKAPEAWLLGSLGCLISAYAGMSLIGRQPRWRWLSRAGLPLGVASGALGAAFSTNGPPVILHVAARDDWNADQRKAVLSGFFLISGVMTAATHALGGLTTPDVLIWLAWGIWPMVFGSLLGIWLYTRLGEHDYRQLVFGLILVMGAMLIVRSIG